MVNIRQARLRDIGAINQIYNHAVLHSVASFDIETKSLQEQQAWYALHGTRFPILVAEHEQEIVGWGALSPYSPRCGYAQTVESSIYVAEGYRRRGIGSLLKAGLIDAGRIAGFHVILALIEDSNTASLKINRRLGFRQVGTLREVGRKAERWLNVTIMELRIGDVEPE